METLKKKYSYKRMFFLALMVVTTVAMDFAVAFLIKADEYDLINLLISSIVLLIVAIVWLEFDRVSHEFSDEKYGNYARIFVSVLFSSIMIIICSFFKLTIIPISTISLGISLITGPTTGIVFGSYFSVIYFSVLNVDYRFFVLYLILTIIGAITARLFTDKETYIGGSIVLMCTYFICSIGIYFAIDQTISLESILYAVINGVVAVGVSILHGRYVAAKIDNVQNKRVEALIDEDCDIRLEMHEKNPESYFECVSISEMAYVAAGVIGADANLAKAGGLYSRIGIIAGENIETNNTIVSDVYNFPTNLIQCIYEVSSKDTKPTSKEAGIVYMAIKCHKAFSVLKNDTIRSGWNKEIVLQQVFNNATNDGSLENSGITMNDFVKIKNCFSSMINNG